MSRSDPANRDDPSNEALEEAIRLFMAVRDGKPDHATAEQRLHDWLARSAEHRLAYGEVQKLWSVTGDPATKVAKDLEREGRPVIHAAPWPPPRTTTPYPPRRRLRRVVYGLLGVAAALVAVSPLPSDLMLRLDADHISPVTERSRIDLPDGSTVDLDAGAALSVSYEAGIRRVALLRGRAWFDVEPDAARPFVVATGFGAVRVLGTSFGIARRDGEAVLSVTEGKVALQDAGRPRATLVKGEQVVFSNSQIQPVGPFDEARVTAWRRDELIFFKAPLSKVIDELNARRFGRIFIAGQGIGERTVSGVFSLKDPRASLEIIANALDLDVTRITGLLVVLR
ncbi:MAG: FecR domain-containing protein [Pseudomonadota bacterium]